MKLAIGALLVSVQLLLTGCAVRPSVSSTVLAPVCAAECGKTFRLLAREDEESGPL